MFEKRENKGRERVERREGGREWCYSLPTSLPTDLPTSLPPSLPPSLLLTRVGLGRDGGEAGDGR